MLGLRILVADEAVDAYLQENKLEHGFVPLEACLLQLVGTADGNPCAMLVATIDGRKVLIKTTLKLFMAASAAMNGATERHLGPDWRGP